MANSTLRWACGSTKPSLEASPYPLCLTITPGRSAAINPKPTRSLCLSGDAQDTDTPMWCYNRMNSITDGCSYYLYWSPCMDCGPAWRLFDTFDLSSSYYKLEDIDTRERALDWVSTLNQTTGDWIAWSSYFSDWFDVDMNIEPCQDPLSECMVPTSTLDTTGLLGPVDDVDAFCAPLAEDSDDSLGLNGPVIAVVGVVLLLLGFGGRLLFCKQQNGTTTHDGTAYAHSDAWNNGGGGFSGGGGDGGGGGC